MYRVAAFLHDELMTDTAVASLSLQYTAYATYLIQLVAVEILQNDVVNGLSRILPVVTIAHGVRASCVL